MCSTSLRLEEKKRRFVSMLVRFWANGRSFQGEAFLFDKDGTLITFDHWFSVMAERARRLSSALGLSQKQAASLAQFMGVNRGQPGNWGIIPLPRPEAEEATARFLAEMLRETPDNLLALVKRIFAGVDEDFPFVRYIKPTPGAEETLKAIKKAGGRVGVVTHDLASAAWQHFRALGWEELVDAVVGLDVCSLRKPAPDPIWKACALLGVSPKGGVVLGDTAMDLQAGRAAGCRATLGVLTGLGKHEELRPLADAVLPDLRGLSFA